MLPYLLVIAVAIGINLLPVFAPPTWTALVGLLMLYDLNPWITVFCGICGATLGRYLLTLYAPSAARLLLSAGANENLAYLGGKLNTRARTTVVFVFFYSLTPLSTSALFTAAAIARTRTILLLPPFFVAKWISYGILVSSANHLLHGAADIWQHTFSLRGIISAIFGIVLLVIVLVIDWRTLLEERRLRWLWSASEPHPKTAPEAPPES